MYKNLTNKAYLLLSVSSHPLALTLGTYYNTTVPIFSFEWSFVNCSLEILLSIKIENLILPNRLNSATPKNGSEL